MKYNDDGTIKEIVVKAGDTLPVGTIVEYDGTVIPAGYEEVEDMGEEYDLTQYLSNTNFNNLVRSKCVKKNGIVYMSVFTGYAIVSGSVDTAYVLFTGLPDELMPDINIDFLVEGESTDSRHNGRGYINTASNTLVLNMPVAPNSTYRYIFNVAYPAKTDN